MFSSKTVKRLSSHVVAGMLVLLAVLSCQSRVEAWWPRRCANACWQNDVWFQGVSVPLFNGKDLSGWTNVEGGTPPAVWSVKDGMITKSNPAPKADVKKTTGDLYTAKKYDNFILEFEFKIAKKGNSGVKYKSWNTKGYGLGCEFQVYDDINDAKNKPVYRTGSLYAVYEPFPCTAPLRMDDFNRGKIVVMGNHIEHWLNGQLTVSTNVGSCDWWYRVSRSKFADTPEFGTTQIGRILLQDHGSEVWFKNIVITPLFRNWECQILPQCE